MRDCGRRCVYCGETFASAELTVDHVQPRVRGGDRSGGNLVTACGACNVAKGHRRLAEFLRATRDTLDASPDQDDEGAVPPRYREAGVPTAAHACQVTSWLHARPFPSCRCAGR